jgi:putative addiction module killer protein
LETRAAAKVAVAQTKLSLGQFGNLKAVGEGIFEYRIDYGPGYRIYLAHDGLQYVILLGGGDKTTQDRDIAEAKELWTEYKRRKAQAMKTADRVASVEPRRSRAGKKKR